MTSSPHSLFSILCLLPLLGCQKPTSTTTTKSEPPGKVVVVTQDEKSLNTVVLTAQAEQRLGIRTAKVAKSDVPQKIALGGEILVPPGQSVTITAPITGTLAAPKGAITPAPKGAITPAPKGAITSAPKGAITSAPNVATTPAPGSSVAQGDPIFELVPVLTSERDVLTPADRVRVAQTKVDAATLKIEAQRLVESAKVEVERAKIAFDRAVSLLKNKAGSQRTVDEADAQLKLAREALLTAQTRAEFLAKVTLDSDAGDLTPRLITSPVAGVLQSIDTASGQTVSAGDRLFQVVNLDHVWVRVPVYVGQRREIDTSRDAEIIHYGATPNATPRTGRFVSAPPSANALAASVDLFFELDNQQHDLHPGERVPATLTLKSSAPRLVVPWSAVMHDIHGGTWVYEQSAPQTYIRRRIDVLYVDSPNAILASGPPAGTHIVTEGAAELFGTEFGVGK